MYLEEVEEVKECKDKKSPFEVGKKYFIRTVTMYYTGELKKIYDDYLILKDAAWIADTARFHDFLKDGKTNEVEPFIKDVIIQTGTIVDVTEWQHDLPREQK